MSALAMADGAQRAQPRCCAEVRPAPDPAVLDLVRDLPGFDGLERDWNDLFERAGRSTHVFQSYAWLWHWTRHFFDPATCELAIVTAHRDGRLVLVWPLVVTAHGPVRQLAWMGEPVGQYGDVLAESRPDTPDLLRRAWKHLATHVRADLASLRKTRADSIVAPFLAGMAALPVCRDRAPFADLTGAQGFETYADWRWPAKTRKNRRRQMRRLEEIGPVLVERHQGGPAAAALASQAIAAKRDWLARRGLVSPALAHPGYQGFFAAIAEGRERPAGCRVSALRVDGAPAAFEIAVRCKDRIAVHLIAYDRAFERGGAGAALMEAGIRDACAEGIACFDLLGPGGGYKDEWADRAVGLVDWVVPMSARGRIYARAWLGFLRPRLKTAANTMPLAIRKLAAAVLRLPARA